MPPFALSPVAITIINLCVVLVLPGGFSCSHVIINDNIPIQDTSMLLLEILHEEVVHVNWSICYSDDDIASEKSTEKIALFFDSCIELYFQWVSEGFWDYYQTCHCLRSFVNSRARRGARIKFLSDLGFKFKVAVMRYEQPGSLSNAVVVWRVPPNENEPSPHFHGWMGKSARNLPSMLSRHDTKDAIYSVTFACDTNNAPLYPPNTTITIFLWWSGKWELYPLGSSPNHLICWQQGWSWFADRYATS